MYDIGVMGFPEFLHCESIEFILGFKFLRYSLSSFLTISLNKKLIRVFWVKKPARWVQRYLSLKEITKTHSIDKLQNKLIYIDWSMVCKCVYDIM